MTDDVCPHCGATDAEPCKLDVEPPPCLARHEIGYPRAPECIDIYFGSAAMAEMIERAAQSRSIIDLFGRKWFVQNIIVSKDQGRATLLEIVSVEVISPRDSAGRLEHELP